jgi:hypothetical protein
MKSSKKTWKFRFNNGKLDWIERLPVTEKVEGEKVELEEGTFVLIAEVRAEVRAEARSVKKAIRAAMESRRLARDEILSVAGAGTYEEEDGNITIKFDSPGTETL